jgi:RNA polymerase sigma-70 factor (ECF subfamily)
MTSPEAESDEELMARLQGGDDGALNALMERWQAPVRGYLYRYSQSEATAHDLAQDTFVRIYQHKHRYKPGARFKTWLFTIATNLCRNHARWRRRHPTESLDEFDWDESAIIEEDNDSPADALRHREKVAAVRGAIDSLPHDLRVVTLLFEYENLSYLEIATVLECSPKAVETRLYRARQRLRQALDSYLNHQG